MRWSTTCFSVLENPLLIVGIPLLLERLLSQVQKARFHENLKNPGKFKAQHDLTPVEGRQKKLDQSRSILTNGIQGRIWGNRIPLIRLIRQCCIKPIIQLLAQKVDLLLRWNLFILFLIKIILKEYHRSRPARSNGIKGRSRSNSRENKIDSRKISQSSSGKL